MKYLALLILLTGCYTRKVAVRQHAKAVVFDPKIGADFCAGTYPCLTDPVGSDTVTVYDTLWGDPEVQILTDTVMVNDTVRITNTVQLPAKTVIKTVTIRDTIKVKDQAALASCEGYRNEATRLQGEERAERLKYQGRARKYLWGIIGLVGSGLLLIFFRLRRKTALK